MNFEVFSNLNDSVILAFRDLAMLVKAYDQLSQMLGLPFVSTISYLFVILTCDPFPFQQL